MECEKNQEDATPKVVTTIDLFSSEFTMLGNLGTGAFAQVWKVEEKKTGRLFAAKVLPKKDDLSNSSKVQNEVMFLQRFSGHPNIVTLDRVISSPQNVYLIQEIAEKGDLFYEIKKNFDSKTGLGLDRAQCYFRDLVFALKTLHSEGIAHCDIKAENCLITKDDKLLLCDFGFTTSKLKSTKLCGTIDYLSPEMIICELKLDQYEEYLMTSGDSSSSSSSGKKKFSFSPITSDVWACGILLYFILTSTLPFSHHDENQIKLNILSSKIEYPETISPIAAQLLSCLLEKNPNKRYTIQQVYDHPFVSACPKC